MQYVRWRPLHTSGFFTVTWVLVIYAATSVHIALCAAQSPAQEWHQDSQQPEMFSPLWAAELATEKPSCNATGLIFTWQHRGFGSNVNNLLNMWVYALVVKKWNDLAVDMDPTMMMNVECAEESRGKASNGWHCLFAPVPRLCMFLSNEDWIDYNKEMGLSGSNTSENAGPGEGDIRYYSEWIVESLDGFAVDHFGALSTMVKYLWSFMTPWLRDEVNLMARAAHNETFAGGPYVGLHIRRGDKVTTGEAAAFDAEVYLTAAVRYLEGDAGRTSVELIKGIWVASDDPDVLEEVRSVAHLYFPNISNGSIAMVSDKLLREEGVTHRPTFANAQRYSHVIEVFVDLEMLTAADLFVGTFSSNIGRLVAILRESIGQKERDSAISIDMDWFAGR